MAHSDWVCAGSWSPVERRSRDELLHAGLVGKFPWRTLWGPLEVDRKGRSGSCNRHFPWGTDDGRNEFGLTCCLRCQCHLSSIGRESRCAVVGGQGGDDGRRAVSGVLSAAGRSHRGTDDGQGRVVARGGDRETKREHADRG